MKPSHLAPARSVPRVTAWSLWFVVIVCLQVAAVPGSTARAAGPDDDRLLAHGTEQMYWVAKVSPPRAGATPGAGGASDSVRSVIQGRTNGGQRWHVLSRLDARVTAMTDRAESVAVLLQGGDWMLLWPGGGAVGRPLPGKTQMLALAGSSDALWAVGRGNLVALPGPRNTSSTMPTTGATEGSEDMAWRAGARPPAATTDPSSLTRGGAGSPDLVAATAVSADTMPQGESLGLFEFLGNQWLLRAALPDEFDADSPDDLSLTLAASRPMIAVRDRGQRLHVVALDRDGHIDDLGTIGMARSFKLIGSGQPALLWTATGSPAGTIYRVDQLAAPLKVLTAPAKLAEGAPMAVASALGSIRLIFERDGAAYQQTYSMSGETRGEPQSLPLVESAGVERFPEWLMLPLLLLLAFLLFGPVRRRELTPVRRSGDRSRAAGSRGTTGSTGAAGMVAPSQPEAFAGAGAAVTAEDIQQPLMIAPTRLRFMAGVVDALPIIIVSFYVAATVQSAPPEEFADVMYSWRWVIYGATALYLLHTTITELFTQRTFGKWILGLRVVNLDGRAPGVVAILARNILRMVDVNLLFPLLLIAITPYHQRLGDVVARTVVVADAWDADEQDE